MKKYFVSFGLTLIVVMSFNSKVFAATSASEPLEAHLPEKLEVEFIGGTTSTTILPETGALAGALAPQFGVYVNCEDDYLVLSATVVPSEGGTINAMSQDTGTDYLTLVNTEYVPTTAQIQNAQGGSPATADNPNAIAYTMSITSSQGTPAYNTGDNSYHITDIPAGNTTVTLNVTTAARTGTYEQYVDLKGAYRAVLTLAAYEL